MNALPSELVDLLFSYLPTPSIKSLRRTCKSFAVIGEAHLFNSFEFRLFPNRHRLEQLKELSHHDTISPRLETLAYESGVQLEYADYRYWKAQVYQAESDKFSRGVTTDGISEEQYRRFHTHLDSRFTDDMGMKYELHREHLDHEATFMAAHENIAALSGIMQALCSRKSERLAASRARKDSRHSSIAMKVVMAEPEITLDALTDFVPTSHDGGLLTNPNPRWRVQRRRENCLRHFTTFFEAAYLAKWDVYDLIAINFPRELLVGSSHPDIGITSATFRNLQSLRLEISELPHSDWLSRGGDDIYHRGRNTAAFQLARLLDRSDALKSLAVQFPPQSRAEYSFEIFDQTNIDRFPRNWLSGLQVFTLANFQCTWDDLNALLASATSMRDLTLSEGRLETGSMIELILNLRTMNLERVRLDGCWRVYEDEGEWHSHHEAVYSECSISAYEGPYMFKGLRHRIERYIIDGGQCPLSKWTADGHEERIWEREGDTSWHYIPFPH